METSENKDERCLIPDSAEIKTDHDTARVLSSHSWSLLDTKPYAGGGILISWACSKCGTKRMSIIVPKD